jgi:hypothetical protein
MRHRHTSGPEQWLPSIMPLVTYLMDDRSAARAEPQPSAADGPQPRTGNRRAGARRLRVIAAGTAATGIPAMPALAWLIEQRHGAALPLAIAAVTAASAAILGTTAVMYEARQETMRAEIEHRSTNTIAAALARYIDSTTGQPGRG